MSRRACVRVPCVEGHRRTVGASDRIGLSRPARRSSYAPAHVREHLINRNNRAALCVVSLCAPKELCIEFKKKKHETLDAPQIRLRIYTVWNAKIHPQERTNVRGGRHTNRTVVPRPCRSVIEKTKTWFANLLCRTVRINVLNSDVRAIRNGASVIKL